MGAPARAILPPDSGRSGTKNAPGQQPRGVFGNGRPPARRHAPDPGSWSAQCSRVSISPMSEAVIICSMSIRISMRSKSLVLIVPRPVM